MIENNVRWVHDNNLCHGCGACAVACPFGAIDIVNNGKNNFPLINANCTDCNKCNEVCSGQTISIDKSMIFDSKESYIAHANNKEIIIQVVVQLSI